LATLQLVKPGAVLGHSVDSVTVYPLSAEPQLTCKVFVRVKNKWPK